MAVSSLAVRFEHFLIGSLKRVLLWRFFLLFLIHSLNLEYSSSDELYESKEEESDELGSESGSAGTSGTILGGLLRGAGFPLDVMISNDDSYDGDEG